MIEARRLLLLGGQGLLEDPERPATLPRIQSAVEALGFVQVDSIATCARAHDLTLFARLDRYRPEQLRRLAEERRTVFENWTHDASIIPTRWFVHWKPRFSTFAERIGKNGWWKSRFGDEPERMFREVEERVREEGPILARDFEGERLGEKGWWGWKPAKAALEMLWRSGRLSIARRVNFQKVYDLTERVFPNLHAAAPPSGQENVNWACSTAMDRLGFATPRELAAFWGAVPLAEARRWCLDQAASGAVTRVSKTLFALPDWQDRASSLPAAPDRIRFLSPFDPVIRDRARALVLFNFDYRFEAFVPERSRVYGYYVLPILEGDRFVGRIDPKAHRESGVLEIRGLWWEPGVKLTRSRRARLSEALDRLAAFTGARTLSLRAGM